MRNPKSVDVFVRVAELEVEFAQLREHYTTEKQAAWQREELLRGELAELRADNERLAAVVERLPKTADLVSIWLNDVVFGIYDDAVVQYHVNGLYKSESYPGGFCIIVAPVDDPVNFLFGNHELFSTREAAEAAKGGGR